MSRPKDSNGLTPQQEHFAQLVASGLNYSTAYRQAYNVRPDTPGTTFWDHASELARHAFVKPRIDALRHAIQSQVTARQAWTLERIVAEAQTNLEIAREGGFRGIGSANGALELIGRATGLLTDKPQQQVPQITRVVVVLNRGADAEERPQVVETSYAVLPMEAGVEIAKKDSDET